ncbi:MAG: hypothetical protein J7497_14465, partial [Chitinophagaceae bacterium]|nr:hypothetical protein [Chitinophagaceae bacterium]
YGTKEWKDGNKKLEDQLPEIVARLEVEAQRINEAQIESRKREEEYREKEKQRLAFEQRKNTELVNFRKLIGDLDRWHLTQRLRQYLNDLEKHAAANNILTGELKEWLIWAHQKTDWYDPFISAKDEWLTEEDIRKIFTVEKSPYYSSFTNDAESSSYFPRPWYTK